MRKHSEHTKNTLYLWRVYTRTLGARMMICESKDMKKAFAQAKKTYSQAFPYYVEYAGVYR